MKIHMSELRILSKKYRSRHNIFKINLVRTQNNNSSGTTFFPGLWKSIRSCAKVVPAKVGQMSDEFGAKSVRLKIELMLLQKKASAHSCFN